MQKEMGVKMAPKVTTVKMAPREAAGWIIAAERLIGLVRKLWPKKKTEPHTRREKFVAAVRSKIGRPYEWGGNGPDAFDCSGLVIWAMRAAGANIPDMTAQSIYEYYEKNKILEAATVPGCIYFYGKNIRSISHCMVVIDVWDDGTSLKADSGGFPIIAGASGGARTVTDEAAAAGAMAGVMTEYAAEYWRTGIQAIVDPWQGDVS